VITGSLLAIVPLVVAFVRLQRFWRGAVATGSLK
jgi:multiple sugar transport system permease protein